MIKGTSHNKFYLSRIASKILVAVCLFISFSFAQQYPCVQYQASTSYFNCSTVDLPISRDGDCIIQCSYTGGRSYYTYLRVQYSTSYYGSLSREECSNYANYCTNACDINPNLPACRNPETDCQDQGGVWEDGECKFIDSTACDLYRAECEQYGGKFVGHPVSTDVSSTGCLSHCSMCNSQATNNYRKAIAASCCSVGQVPPEDVTRCYDDEIAGQPDMGWSTFDCDNRGDNDCSCDYLSDNNASRYKSVCLDHEFEEPNGDSGSSSDGSSSGSGDSTGLEPPYRDYYPILDTIRDTLNDIRNYTKEIAECLRYGTCKAFQQEGGDTTIVNVDGGSDSSYIKKTNVKLDSLYDAITSGDSSIAKILKDLDTSLVKAIGNVPTVSDSNYIKSTADSISAANDTTRKWLKRIADSLGVGTDSLIAHLDSIVKRIPDTLLDSILKYQQYSGDNFDSVLYGKGKGFSLIDSLIDSTVKYLGEGTRSLDSSIGGIGDRLDSMYNGNGSLPGDTSGSDIYDGWIDGEESDTTGNGYLIGLGFIAQAGLNDTSLDRIYGINSSSSIGDTSIYSLPSVDSLHLVLQESIDQDYQTLEDTLKNYFDTLRNEIQLINFDSAIIAPLGMIVPNTNTCPVDCFSIDLSGAGTIYSSVKGLSWPLCKSYSAMGGLNVLQFIRLILRIVTAIGCVYIGMWFIAGKK